MDKTGDITQQRQDNVQNKGPAEAFPQQYAQWRKNNGNNNTPETHNYSLASKIQVIVKKDNFFLSVVIVAGIASFVLCFYSALRSHTIHEGVQLCFQQAIWYNRVWAAPN
jgi:hypothetical protein